MSKVVKAVAMVALQVGVAVVTAGSSVWVQVAVRAAVAVGSAVLLAPKSSSSKPSPAQLSRLTATVDPSTPRKIVFGQTALATDVRYEEPGGSEQEYWDRIICCASHAVEAIDEIWFDDKQAWTAGGGVTSTYAGYLTVNTRLEGSAANTIAINGGAKWGSTRRLTGLAYLHLRYKRTGNSKKAESPFSGGIPSRISIRGKGMKLYDPRRDSTNGGSGTMRPNDQSTWAYTASGTELGQNPALQILTYLLGWKINGKLAVGKGIPASRIDMASFITAANLCDENVALAAGGTEKRYRAAGVFSEADAPTAVLDTLLAACAGTLRDAGGKLSLHILYNDLSDYYDLNDDDVLGAFIWEQTPSLESTYNVVRGRWTDPSNSALYQMIDYPQVKITSPDGIDRIATRDYPVVQSVSQAQRLAKQDLQRAQYQGMFRADFGARALGVKVGKVVRLTFSALGWSNKLFRVVEQTIRPDGVCPLVLREENSAIYAWAAEEAAPVTPTAPTIYNPLNAPLVRANDDALTAAQDASAQAASALAELDQIGADGWLAPDEKLLVKREYDDLLDAYVELYNRATSLGLSTTTLQSVINALQSYLGGLSPAWTSTSAATSISRTTWNANWRNAWQEIARVAKAISEEDAKRAVWGSGITGQPADSRLLNGAASYQANYITDWNFEHWAGVANEHWGAGINPNHILPEAAPDGRRLRISADNVTTELVTAMRPARNGDRIDAQMEIFFASWPGHAGLYLHVYDANLNYLYGAWLLLEYASVRGNNYWFRTPSTPDNGTLTIANANAAFVAISVAGGGSSGNVYLRKPVVMNMPGAVSYIAPTGRASSALLTRGFLVSASAYVKGLAPTIGSTSMTFGTFQVDFGDGFVSIDGATISGLAASTTYNLWLLAPNLSNAGRSFSVSTLLDGNVDLHRIRIGTFTTAASGSSGGSTGGGGGGWCVDVDAWLIEGLRAGDATAGAPIDILDLDRAGYSRGHIGSVERAEAECVELVSASGARVICSVTTPMERLDGSMFYAPDALGELVAVDIDGRFDWEPCVAVHPVGVRPVARIHIGGRVYAAGTSARARIFTHNPLK